MLRNRRIAYAVTGRDLRVVDFIDLSGVIAPDGQDAVGRSLLELVPELVGSEALLTGLVEGRQDRIELQWVNRPGAGGETVYLNMVDLPRHDEAGEICGVVHLVEDVSDLGRLNQRLMQNRNELLLLKQHLDRKNLTLEAANLQLEHLAEVRSRFVSIAAHELRTPLTAIKGYVDFMLQGMQGELTEQQHNSLRVVLRSANRLLEITNNLLDVTRIETGELELL
ncbi:MAG: histidine kinase dimerization/phospho-acceptor domain-containing protein, partial [Anaerolineae bacterium]